MEDIIGMAKSDETPSKIIIIFKISIYKFAL